jgi:hypothetical protein
VVLSEADWPKFGVLVMKLPAEGAFFHSSSSRMPSILGEWVILTACVRFGCAIATPHKNVKKSMEIRALSIIFGVRKNSRKSQC